MFQWSHPVLQDMACWRWHSACARDWSCACHVKLPGITGGPAFVHKESCLFGFMANAVCSVPWPNAHVHNFAAPLLTLYFIAPRLLSLRPAFFLFLHGEGQSHAAQSARKTGAVTCLSRVCSCCACYSFVFAAGGRRPRRNEMQLVIV